MPAAMSNPPGQHPNVALLRYTTWAAMANAATNDRQFFPQRHLVLTQASRRCTSTTSRSSLTRAGPNIRANARHQTLVRTFASVVLTATKTTGTRDNPGSRLLHFSYGERLSRRQLLLSFRPLQTRARNRLNKTNANVWIRHNATVIVTALNDYTTNSQLHTLLWFNATASLLQS